MPVAVETKKTSWCSPEVTKSIKLKKEAFRALLSQRSPKATDGLNVARRTGASIVADTKTLAWEEVEGAK